MAAADAGPGETLLQAIDVLVAIGLTVDAAESGSPAKGMVRNVPHALATKLDISPAAQFYSQTGGNTPQMLVNRYAEEISQGQASAVLLVGAEALSTMLGRLKSGLDLDAWVSFISDLTRWQPTTPCRGFQLRAAPMKLPMSATVIAMWVFPIPSS